jgi:hypothetical protein
MNIWAMIGTGVGAMIDPLLWLTAGALVFAVRVPMVARVVIAVAIWTIAAVIIHEWVGKRFGPFNTQMFLIWLLAGGVWFAIFAGIKALIDRRKARA